MDLEAACGHPRAPEGLHRYRVIVVPQARPLTEAEAVALRGYVTHGGALLLESPSVALRDHQPWIEALVGARQLREPQAYAFYLLPDHPELWRDLPPGDPVQFYVPSFSLVELTDAQAVGLVVPQFRDKVRTSDIQTVANVPARPDQAPRHPGILLHRMGAGSVLTTVLPLTAPNRDADRSPWARVLTRNCLHLLLGEPLVSIPGNGLVEAVLCRQPGRYVLHFLNHRYGAGAEIPVTEEDFVRDLPVRLSASLRGQVAAATLEPEGVPLPLTADGFTLPQLGVHQAVALTLAAGS
jgi:hypothetical protein